MKFHLLIVRSLLLAATFTTSAFATETPTSDPLVEFTGRPYVERGMNRETVRAMLGAPSAQLSADAWVYFDFQAANPVASATRNPAGIAAKQDALVVAFKNDRVSLIRACDSQPVRAFIAQQAKSKVPAPAIAAK